MPITLRFTGGPRDRQTLSTASADASEVQLAAAYYLLTVNGAVGKRVRSYTELALQALTDADGTAESGPRMKIPLTYDQAWIYRVVARTEDGEIINVMLECVSW
jgi:hypothetical protein